MIEEIEKVILSHYKNGYNTDELNDIIIELIKNHIFTSKDSIQNLINELENLKEEI